MIIMRIRGAPLFWLAITLVSAGVLLHFPDYLMSRDMHYAMAHLTMSPMMRIGMALIVAGVVCGGVFLVRQARGDRDAQAVAGLAYHPIDKARLTGPHLRSI